LAGAHLDLLSKSCDEHAVQAQVSWHKALLAMTSYYQFSTENKSGG
jgi:hypothetical protein